MQQVAMICAPRLMTLSPATKQDDIFDARRTFPRHHLASSSHPCDFFVSICRDVHAASRQQNRSYEYSFAAFRASMLIMPPTSPITR